MIMFYKPREKKHVYINYEVLILKKIKRPIIVVFRGHF